MSDTSIAVYQLLSGLLEYPPASPVNVSLYQEALSQLPEDEIKSLLLKHMEYLTTTEEHQVAMDYVTSFDFNEKCSLSLTSHICHEERQRGGMLAELKQLYSQAGFELVSQELPDYLPMVLEFVSVSNSELGLTVLETVRPGMMKLLEGMKEYNSPYSSLIQACVLATTPEFYLLQSQEEYAHE